MNWLQPLRRMITIGPTRKGLLAGIAVATILLTSGYLLGRLWLEVPVVLLVGVLWALCVLRDIRRVASLLFLVFMGAAAVGYMVYLSHILMLAAGCATVLAWDLHQFEGRLLDLGEQTTVEIEKRHLQRSLMVLGFSFVLIAADSWLNIRVQFIILISVTILVILILNQTILLIRRAGRPAPPKE